MSFERISDVTKAVLDSIDGGRGDLKRLVELKEHWEEIVGASLSGDLTPLRAKDDVLEIGASTAAWLNEARFFEETLKGNIARHTGQRYKRIRFTLLKRVRVDARKKRDCAPRPSEEDLSPDDAKRVEDVTKRCRDGRLRERLRSLFLKSARRVDQGPRGCKP